MGLDMYITTSEQQVPAPWDSSEMIDLQLAYWRKAHHLHRWFVANVQADTDNCEKYIVTRKQIQALLAIYETIDECSAFEYVSDSKIMLRNILDSSFQTFYYQSSW